MADDQDRPKLPGGITGKGFRPGQSGNPSGRPRGFQKAIREKGIRASGELLLKIINGDFEGRPKPGTGWGEYVAFKKLQIAAAELFLTHTIGKPAPRTDLDEADGRSILNFIFTKIENKTNIEVKGGSDGPGTELHHRPGSIGGD